MKHNFAHNNSNSSITVNAPTHNTAQITKSAPNLWHPFTNMYEKNFLSVTHASNEMLYTSDKRQFIDLISSWWVSILGHSNKEIAQSIYEQALKLEQVIFANFTHEPAQKLAINLHSIMDPLLNKVFFSDNGSCAVEIAVKMSYQYFKNLNNQTNQKCTYNKFIFINFSNGYHGDTIGAMTVGDSKYHEIFNNIFLDENKCTNVNATSTQKGKDCENTIKNQHDNTKNKHSIYTIEFIETYEDINEDLLTTQENLQIEKLQEFLQTNHHNVCAFICEPLLQGASGMRICRISYINKILKVMKQYDILIIFDEIFTGFYRTGLCFAYENLNTLPDIICLSKALTGGTLPLALTITNEKVYNAFLNHTNNVNKTFLHGHSFTANPLCCSAVNKTLEILKRDEIQQMIKNLIIQQKNFINTLKILNQLKQISVKKLRHIGTVCAFDMKTEDDAMKFCDEMFKRGIFMRPLGTALYILPPYTICLDNLQMAYQNIIDVLKLNFFNKIN